MYHDTIRFTGELDARAPAAKGTLVASGGVNGRWSLKSCTVSPSQGVFALQLSFGPGRGYPALTMGAQLAASVAPVVASRTVNLATAETDFVDFQTNSTGGWSAGADFLLSDPHRGSGVLSTSPTATSGTDCRRGEASRLERPTGTPQSHLE